MNRKTQVSDPGKDAEYYNYGTDRASDCATIPLVDDHVDGSPHTDCADAEREHQDESLSDIEDALGVSHNSNGVLSGSGRGNINININRHSLSRHSRHSRHSRAPTLSPSEVIPEPPLILGADVQVDDLIKKALDSGSRKGDRNDKRGRCARDVLLFLCVLVFVPLYAIV